MSGIANIPMAMIQGSFPRVIGFPLVAIGFGAAIAFVGTILIHRNFGGSVGEYCNGGSEYGVASIILLLIVAAADQQPSVQPPND
jgi:hypothetical protein